MYVNGLGMFKPDPIYEFPPFFTRQPNEDTWKAQLNLWNKVITQFCNESGKWQLSHSSPVFSNPRIQRHLNPDVVDAVLKDMCKQGNAERIGPSEIYVYNHKPTELAYELHQWAQSSGHAGSVMTFYELTEGELPGLDKFKGIDTFLLKRVADIMVKRGEAAVLKEDGEMVGLKLS